MDTISDLTPSWERHLKAINRAPRTIASYLEAAGLLHDWLVKHRPDYLDSGVAGVTQADLESYIGGEQDRTSASNAASQYRRLQQLFRWLLEEEEISDSPMRRMSAPHVPEKAIPVIPEGELRKLVAACEGRDFVSRRDEAIVRLFIDTGIRSDEMAGLKVASIDFDYAVIVVLGKGRKNRSVPFGANTARALDRYLRMRRHHRYAESEWLWIGGKGRLSASGVQQMVDRRCAKAGIPHIHLHRFRHSNANEWLLAGGAEGDLERIMGWSAGSGMVRHYAKSAADHRAREAHKRMALGDRF